jgi:hypothetical protein
MRTATEENTMLRFILHRLLATIHLLISLSLVSFVLMSLHTCSEDSTLEKWPGIQLLHCQQPLFGFVNLSFPSNMLCPKWEDDGNGALVVVLAI